MKELSPRQTQIAALVAKGLPDKQIARETGLSLHTVRQHIQDAAQRVPGEGYPKFKLALWFLNVTGD